ncbi:MAG: trypsin-like peptidase domain-containing protein [Ornithinimicrobium sp.]|uniref:S1C family serine protease n=1 Tax=Ornithinimicrobium sp. TaxID=1977084 RepID=UPI0026E089CF|nr:trypsin-like peptidase domain-containing protein [Ornithinimicrobium sp.]MDO5740569.1 trypsin-like peptidase domain-containing protein [Ornithinimicrobium sp.]
MSTSPQGPEPTDDALGHAEHTAPIHPQTEATAAVPPHQGKRSGPRRRWGDIAVASVLAAALSSGGTYAAVRAADSEAPAAAVSNSSNAAVQGSVVSLTGAQDWAAIASSVTPSVVSIDVAGQSGVGAGSGVIWDNQGHLVTNAHVVEGAQQLRVFLADGRSYSGKVVGTDVSTDLAVVKLDNVPANLTPITVGDDSALRVGDPVMAVGNPLGLSGTVTTGIVSALDRPVSTQGAATQQGSPASQVVTNAIQTSAAINPGNSGGALVDGAGHLVGINSSIAALPTAGQSQPGSIGIGFAIPSNEVKLIADQLIAHGSAQHAFLGVGLKDGEATVDGATLTGAQVQQVEDNSPAKAAGLQAGDLIVGIDGEAVPSATALVGQVRERGAGKQATLSYVRDGQKAEATVTLATRPDEG